MAASALRNFSRAKGPPPSSPLDSTCAGRGAVSREPRISGIVEFGELVASPLAPICFVGLTMACSYAYLPACLEVAPLPWKVVPGFLLLFSFLWFCMLHVLFSMRLRYWGEGRGCCPIVPVGVYVFLFALPLSSFPALECSRFLLRRHVFAPRDLLFRLCACRFSGVLVRGTLRSTN